MTDDKARVIRVVDHGDVIQQPGQTILEALEAQKIDVHYHCREGFCGACRTQLNDGEVEYTIDPLAYINDDEFLPCCCKAISNVTIKLTR